MCPPMRAHWHQLVNTNELVHSLAHSSPQPKWQIDRFSHFCTAHGRKSLYFIMGAPFPKISLTHEDLDPHLTQFLGPIQNQNGISISSDVFAQSVPILYSGMPLPLKIAPSHGGSGLHLIHGSLCALMSLT